MKRLCDAARDCLKEAGLFHKRARLVCGVSGGADSVALLHALSLLRAEAGFHLEALHIQHGLRGRASEEDERFVRDLCAAKGVPFRALRANLHGTMNDPGMETLAREERLRLIQETMISGSFDAVLLGHHRDDQAETVLMRLLRGSGMHGLGGMQRCAPFACGVMLRPFLHIPKADLMAALRSKRAGWREDESNAHPTNPRNSLRLNILPAMEALYPGAGRHIAQTADILRAENDCLDAEAERLFEAAAYCVPPFRLMAKEPLRGAHPAIVRRALRKLCPVPLDYPDALALEALLNAPDGTRLNLPQGVQATVWTRHLHIVHPHDQPSDATHMTIRRQEAQGDVPRSANEIVLSPDVLARNPIVRLPKADDVIRPFGAPGAKPLRRFFTDRKTDPFFRWQLPVVAAGDEVLWIPGVCASEALRLSSIPEGSVRMTFTVSIPFYLHDSKE